MKSSRISWKYLITKLPVAYTVNKVNSNILCDGISTRDWVLFILTCD
ncbi:hypothetical protein ACSVC9_14480 [Clostridium sp. LBM24168]